MRRSWVLVLIWVGATLGLAAQQQSTAPTVTVNGLGRGLFDLNTPWQFHIGDDMQWAQPGINDLAGQGGWETIRADIPWGSQGHYAYTGFGWYRLHLKIIPVPGFTREFQLILPRVSDACEVYWNGRLLGRYGSLPPHPSWPTTMVPTVFTLGGKADGTLAIRVWKGPLGSSEVGEVGGLLQTPAVGDPDSVRAYLDAWNFGFLSATLFNDALDVLYLIVGVAGILLWLRRRREMLLLWFSLFAICPAIWNLLYTMRIPISSQFFQLLIEPLWQLRNVALWFVLLDLLHLRERRSLVRWAKILAVLSLGAAFLDGCLAYMPEIGHSHVVDRWADVAFTLFIEPVDLFLLVLVAFGIRQKLDKVRTVLAVSASLAQLVAVIRTTVQQGRRFTHWTLGDKMSAALIHFGPIRLNIDNLLDLMVFFSILYATFRVIRLQQARKILLEQELQSARELQEVLIPEKPPEVPGYAVTSVYHPALDVGGDFFQIIPLDGPDSGSALVVLGDVSGKGLRAAMAVSLIVGALRALVETTASPAEILAGISRRLQGRLQGGFTTCLAMRLDPGGACTLATAGHPPPYLNDREIDMPGALPLGIDPSTVYEEVSFRLKPGDRCSLYTDGLLEARSPSGEIFSFERLHDLFAAHADAAQASVVAMDFGQEDDITVLTLTRTEIA